VVAAGLRVLMRAQTNVCGTQCIGAAAYPFRRLSAVYRAEVRRLMVRGVEGTEEEAWCE
jgi:hypothetical protein